MRGRALLALSTALSMCPVHHIRRTAGRHYPVHTGAAGSDGVPPLLVDRALPASVEAGKGAAAAAAAAAATSGGAPAALLASMAGLAPKFNYVLFKLGPITLTRKGLNLAVSAGLPHSWIWAPSAC